MIKKVLVLATCMVFLLAGVAQAEYLYLVFRGADVTSITIHPALAQGRHAGRQRSLTVDFGPSWSDFQQYKGYCVDLFE